MIRVVELEHALGVDVAALLHDGVEQGLLVFEIDVEGAFGHAGGAGDLAHARRVKALVEEHPHCAIQDLTALTVFLVRASREFRLQAHWLTAGLFVCCNSKPMSQKYQ